MNKEEFFVELSKSEEGLKYLDLVESRKGLKVSKEPGYEIHHIFPRCFGGTNEKSNLVKLTVYEHLLAHYYLALAIRHPKTLYSFSFIVGPQFNKLSGLEQSNLESLEKWANLREKAIHRELTEEHKRRISESRKGQYLGRRLSRETIEKIRVSKLGHPVSEETRKKISEGNKGKIISKEQRQRLSECNHNKDGHVFRGKHHTEESKRKNRENHVGRVHINNGTDFKMVWPEEIQKYCEQGWVLGRIYKRKKLKNCKNS